MPDGVAVLLMLAPADAAKLAVDGGEAPDQMHVTLGILAKPAAEYSDDEKADIIDRLTAANPFHFDGNVGSAIEADTFATALFNPNDDDRDPCAVVLVQSGDIASAHNAVTRALEDDLSTTFPIWIPHITVAYTADLDVIPTEPIGSRVTFDRLLLCWGDEQIDLTDPVAEAFARGYARATAGHGVPLTERAQIALTAALAIAEASAQPTSPTLNLGQLEGVWAVIYARREAVEKLHGAALQDALDAIAKLNWDSILSAIQTQLLIDPSVSGKMLASEVGTRIENMIAADLPASDRAAWLSAMQSALVDATAEGQAAATALIANASGVTISWDLVAADAKAALEGSQVLQDQAGTWIADQIHGLGYQLAQKLAAMWDDGASRAEMEAMIEALLGTTENNAGLLLDTLIGQALAQGALATYAAAGLEYADFITAGDGRVCPACAQAEDEGPYLLANTPQPPLHPSCLPGTARIVVPADIAEVLASPNTAAATSNRTDGRDATAAAVAKAIGHGTWRGLGAVTERHYVGDFVTIRLELGHELTVTPNHPIATTRGWVRAGDIRESDDVLCRRVVDPIVEQRPDVEHIEATIKQVADALPVRFGPMPSATEDFHGDGTDGQVYVVRTAGQLLRESDVPSLECGAQNDLMVADIATGRLHPDCLGDQLPVGERLAARRGVGTFGDGCAPVGAESVHACVHGCGAAPAGDTRLDEAPVDDCPADAEGFSETLLALTDEITASKVVYVNIAPAFGHTSVYNCNTTQGWYLADGFVVHNCRCAVSPSDFQPTSASLALVNTYTDQSSLDLAA